MEFARPSEQKEMEGKEVEVLALDPLAEESCKFRARWNVPLPRMTGFESFVGSLEIFSLSGWRGEGTGIEIPKLRRLRLLFEFSPANGAAKEPSNHESWFVIMAM